jgi:hypothetical protein
MQTQSTDSSKNAANNQSPTITPASVIKDATFWHEFLLKSDIPLMQWDLGLGLNNPLATFLNTYDDLKTQMQMLEQMMIAHIQGMLHVGVECSLLHEEKRKSPVLDSSDPSDNSQKLTDQDRWPLHPYFLPFNQSDSDSMIDHPSGEPFTLLLKVIATFWKFQWDFGTNPHQWARIKEGDKWAYKIEHLYEREITQKDLHYFSKQ